jgi:hypothetical protein
MAAPPSPSPSSPSAPRPSRAPKMDFEEKILQMENQL